jgi:branched-chain amino acid aminotransferase
MRSGFTLSIYPWVFIAKYDGNGAWKSEYREQPHGTPDEEAAMSPEDLDALLARRNSFPDLPLVNYTSQYGLGCFEGLKSLPQPGGGLKTFRPDQNAARLARSMEGLHMTPFPEELFLEAVDTLLSRNAAVGFIPVYDPEWEGDNFASGHSVYIRPFTYSEPAIGLSLSMSPWVVIVTTPVGSYFRPGNHKAVTTDKVRAHPGGTGWIKCDANYVTPILVKRAAETEGYMEAVFLDAKEGRYVEEGSSCNIFFLLKDGTLVTPSLEDTILPGITRRSILDLAADMGIPTEERRVDIAEVLSDVNEAFVTGTAAGVAYIESMTHRGKTSVFNNGKIGDVTLELQKTLKGIQYGAVPDSHGWMRPAPGTPA